MISHGFMQGPDIINFEPKFQPDVVLFPPLGHALQILNRLGALSEVPTVFPACFEKSWLWNQT